MDNKALPLPDRRNYQYGYQFAYKLACEQLAGVKDLEHRCQKSGSQLKLTGGRKTIILKYLGKTYQVSHPDIEVSLADSEETVVLRDRLLILHYLNWAKGSLATGQAITYKELPGGVSYASNFSKRTIRPLLNNFGYQPERLLDAAAIFDAHRADYGNVAVTINAFSRVPITLVLWRGDDELASEGSILFDSTIPDYLSTEDITVLCENIAWRLASFLKENG